MTMSMLNVFVHTVLCTCPYMSMLQSMSIDIRDGHGHAACIGTTCVCTGTCGMDMNMQHGDKHE